MADSRTGQSNDPPPPPPTRDLLAALARGDSTTHETIECLKDHHADCLDVLVTAIGTAAAGSPERQRAARSFLDPKLFANAPGDDAPSRHKAPGLPLLLNGTLYDPCDIKRFDGTALHFVPAADHIVAIDDRRVIAEYWRQSFISSALADSRYGGYGVFPAKFEFPPLDTGVPDAPYSPNPGFATPAPTYGRYDVGTTYFYDDDRCQGESLALTSNRGYVRLSKVGRGFLGLGDWNDVISSVSTMNRIVVLYEHKNYGGSTLTLERGDRTSRNEWLELNSQGWNDRASSLGTW